MFPTYENQNVGIVYQRPPGYDYSQDRERRYDQFDKDRLQIYKENDNIYLNVVIQNNGIFADGEPNENPIIAEYNVTKTLPILDKCSDYYCSVIRFDIPLQNIPLFIMPILPATSFINPQPDPDLTPLIIGISYLGVDYPINIQYFADNTLPPPVQNVPGVQVITPYYYVYTYQNLITSINIALQTALITSGFPLAGAQAPYFYLNSATQLISLIVPDSFTIGANRPIIFVNATLFNYLETFRVSFLGYNQSNGKDFLFILDNPTYPTYVQAVDVSGNPLSPPLVPPARSAYWKYTQEYPVLNYWTSLRKIIIATNTIPVVNEYVPAQDNNSGITNSFPILTDFVPSLEFAGQSRSIAYYFPTSQYRLVDMINDNPLYKINIKIYWEDKKGNLFPLYIPILQQANIKLGFFRKTLYKPFNQLLYK